MKNTSHYAQNKQLYSACLHFNEYAYIPVPNSNYIALHASTKPEFGVSVISVDWIAKFAVFKSALDNSSNTAMHEKRTSQAGF
jgi:hypothetical protein